MTSRDKTTGSGAFPPEARLAALADAERMGWIREVETEWPTPIAHEYARLRAELRRGSIASALWQFKDLVEVLIRLPTLILARALIDGGAADQQFRARRFLLGGPLTMGSWLRLLRDEMSPAAFEKPDRFDPRIAALAAQIVDPVTGAKTAWARLLGDLVTWRNSDFGHGAFRLDADEYIPALEDLCPRLNRELAALDQGGLWSQSRIATLDTAVILKGATALLDTPWDASIATQGEVALYLTGSSGAPILRLSPFLSLRRCAICDRLGIFCFDGRSGAGQRDALGFVDFARGHAFTLPSHVLPDLAQAAAATPLSDFDGGDLDEDFCDRVVEEALDRATQRARYLAPTYLREPLAETLSRRSRGMVWLCAPGHVGKSTFVRGLAAPEELGESPIAPDLRVAALHIRREFRSTALQARDFLEINLVRDVMKVGARARRLSFDTECADPAAAFARFLSELMRASRHTGRLLICLDGLDEAADHGTVLDWIPRAADLPAEVFLLLTSRPLADCPPAIAAKLSQTLARDPDVIRMDVDLDFATATGLAYQAFARRYFDREVEPALLARLNASLSAFVAERVEGSRLVCRDDLSAALPAALRERVRADWRRLTAGLVVSTPPGAARASSAVAPVLAHNEAVFSALMAASEGRIQFLAHLSRLYADGALDDESLARLPEGRMLYQRYLSEIEQSAGSAKLWDVAQRLILIAVAEAQASDWMIQRSSQSWAAMDGGLDLAGLAQRLGMSGRPARIALLVFELQHMFVVAPDPAGRSSRYRVANDDFVAAVAERWQRRLAEVHGDLARRALDLLELGEDPEGFASEELCGAIAHAALAVPPVAGLDVGGAFSALISDRAAAAQKEGRFDHAVALTTAAIGLAERHLLRRSEQRAAWFLALQLRHRSIARLAMGSAGQALRDVRDSLNLFVDLQRQTAAENGPLIAREIAETLAVKGNAETELGHWRQALADYDASLALIERGDVRLPDPQDLRAAVSHNRARLFGLMGEPSIALAELDALVDALAVQTARLPPGVVDDGAQRLAEALTLRSTGRLAAGAADKALADAERAVALLLPRGLDAARNPLPADIEDGAAQALGQLARLCAAAFDFDRAFVLNGLALDLRLRSIGRIVGPAGASATMNLAGLRSERALLLFQRGAAAEAAAEIDEAIRLGEGVADKGTPFDRQALGLSYSLRAIFGAAGGGDPGAIGADMARAESLGAPAERLTYAWEQIAALRSGASLR